MNVGRIATVIGNPRAGSRTRSLAEGVASALAERSGLVPAPTIDLADHGPALLGWGDPVVTELKATVVGARAVVVASPTYKACFTGLLKLFLDQFDAGELAGTPVVAVMTGGSAAHSLVPDVHLAPVLFEIGASLPARGLYFAGPEIDDPDAVLTRWLEAASPALDRALGA